MVMVVGEGRDDGGPQLVGLGVGHFQRGDFLEVLVEEPGMIDQALQNQRFAAGDRAALAAHDRAYRQLGAGRLIGPTAEGLGGRYPLPLTAPGGESAGLAGRARLKTAARFAATAS